MKNKIYVNKNGEVTATLHSDKGTEIFITSKEFTEVDLPEDVKQQKKIGDKLTKEKITPTIKEKTK